MQIVYMNKSLLIILVPFLFMACVSRNDYEKAQHSAQYWEDAYYEQQEQYQALINKYNSLIDEYNDLANELDEREQIIQNAKYAVYDLENHFNSWCRGWSFYDADDIERDINDVENALDGWY